MSFATGLAIAISAVLSGSPTVSPMPQAQSVEQYVETYFADTPVLIEIARCESHMRQFDKDGNVLKNKTSSAIGIMQIMSSIHDDYADKLGIDIFTMQGNLAYAKHLYEQKGTAPWNASKACWSKSKAGGLALATNSK